MFIESVISSIVGGIILSLLALLLHHTGIPYVRSLISDELDLSGKWSSHFVSSSGNEHDLTLDLKQRFRKLDGVISVKKHMVVEGVTEMKYFAARGYLRDRFVTLSARNKDKQAVGVYVVLLEVLKGARLMKGRSIWYSVTTNAIEQSEVDWKKI